MVFLVAAPIANTPTALPFEAPLHQFIYANDWEDKFYFGVALPDFAVRRVHRSDIVLGSVAAGVTDGMRALRFNRSTSPLTLSYVGQLKHTPAKSGAKLDTVVIAVAITIIRRPRRFIAYPSFAL